jgi:hypothetical protein
MASKERKLSAFERVVANALDDHRELGKLDDPARTDWPELWKFLSTVYVGRDRLKTPARLTISLGPEGCLVSLSDRDLGVSVDVSCSNLAGAFAAIEAQLVSDTPNIRSWGKKEPNLRKRKSGS